MADTAFDPSVPPMLYGNQPPPVVEPPPEQVPAAPPSRALDPNWYPPLDRSSPTPGVTPAQGDQLPTSREPPPIPVKDAPPPTPQPDFDENNELNTASQAEEQLYRGKVLGPTGKELRAPNPVTDADFPDKADDIARLRALIPSMPPKSQHYWIGQAEQMNRQLSNLISQENRKRDRDFLSTTRDQIRQSDVPYQTVEARQKQMAVLQSAGDKLLSDAKADVDVTDPKKSLANRYDYAVSPWNTMFKGKKDDPNNTNPYGTLYQIGTNVANVNRHLQDPEEVMKYVLVASTPVDTRENPNVVGENGFKGPAATSYKIVGRDPRDNYLFQFRDGTVLSIDPGSKRAIDSARKEGYKAGKKFLVDEAATKAKQDQPGMIERAYQTIFPPIPKSP